MTLADDDTTAGAAAGERTDSLPAFLARRPDDPSTRPDLSVVIPTLNEAENVADCLESVFRASRPVESVEVVLVDSNSTDGTVEIAREYPVTILRIEDDAYTSPSAGRYVGGLAARGDQVLFVDGDMRLTEGWLTDAMKTVATDGVAAVDGHLNESAASSPRSIQAPRGVMLYDADVLSELDGFDPFLRGHEDIDLGLRAGVAGYERRRLPVVVATHSRPAGVAEIGRRWHNGYFVGIGQAFRAASASPKSLAGLVRRKWDLVSFLSWFCLAAVLTAVAVPLLAVWLAATGVLFGIDALWEGIDNAGKRWLTYTVAWIGIAAGFALGTRDRSAFPLDAVAVLESQSAVPIERKHAPG